MGTRFGDRDIILESQTTIRYKLKGGIQLTTIINIIKSLYLYLLFPYNL